MCHLNKLVPDEMYHLDKFVPYDICHLNKVVPYEIRQVNTLVPLGALCSIADCMVTLRALHDTLGV